MKDEKYRKRIARMKILAREMAFQPCIGCGYCCRKVPCYYGELGGEFGCVWLEHDGKLWRCGMLTCPELEKERESILQLLYIGSGCCSNLNDWRVQNKIPTPEWIKSQGESSDGFK